MKTRTLYHTDLSFDIEHRTDGWYHRLSEHGGEFEGPFRNVGELSEEFADTFEYQIRHLYKRFYKEEPR